MADRLIRMDYERGKVVVMRTTIDENGCQIERQIELDLPKPPTVEGLVRKVKRGDDGKMYEIGGFGKCADTTDVFDKKVVREYLEKMMDYGIRKKMSSAGKKMCDGGGGKRNIEIIKSLMTVGIFG